jgi:hypothetical protein
MAELPKANQRFIYALATFLSEFVKGEVRIVTIK